MGRQGSRIAAALISVSHGRDGHVRQLRHAVKKITFAQKGSLGITWLSGGLPKKLKNSIKEVPAQVRYIPGQAAQLRLVLYNDLSW